VARTSLLRAERQLIAATNRVDILLHNLAVEHFMANPAPECNRVLDIRNWTNGAQFARARLCNHTRQPNVIVTDWTAR
jgi:hypothetical protein